jgi:hypothetical protein
MKSSASPPAPFVAENVTKSYPGHMALNALDLEVPAGHVVGLPRWALRASRWSVPPAAGCSGLACAAFMPFATCRRVRRESVFNLSADRRNGPKLEASDFARNHGTS